MKPGLSDQQYLKAGKILVIAAGVGSLLIASSYLAIGDEGVLGIVFTLYAIFSGGIAGIFLLGLFSARANRQGLTIGIIACICFTAYAFLTSTKIGLGTNKHLLVDLGAYNFKHHKLMLGVYSHLIVIAVGYTASLFYPKPMLDKNLLYSGWLQNKRDEKNNSLNSFAALFFLLLIGTQLQAQPNSDNQYAKPLKEVLNDVQKRFGVSIKVVDSLVANKMVTYADWKYRNDVETTLDNILRPFELKVKSDGEKNTNSALTNTIAGIQMMDGKN